MNYTPRQLSLQIVNLPKIQSLNENTNSRKTHHTFFLCSVLSMMTPLRCFARPGYREMLSIKYLHSGYCVSGTVLSNTIHDFCPDFVLLENQPEKWDNLPSNMSLVKRGGGLLQLGMTFQSVPLKESCHIL